MKETRAFVFLCCMLMPLSVGSVVKAHKGPIVVASKIDTEGALLGQMIVAVLRANEFQVVDKTEFGPTNLVRRAIISGQIDIYPEYTGNGGFFFKNVPSSVWKNSRKGYQTVKKLDMEENQIVWLPPAPANNTWAIAIRKDVADANKIYTLEDFARYINHGGTIKLACSEEFVNRPDALPAFQKTYGFRLSQEQLVTLSGGNTAQTERAAAQAINGVNAAMAYRTDGALAAFRLHVLVDTKGVQPVFQPAPIVRADILKKYPEIETLLSPVFQSLDLVTLQALNARIALEGIGAKEVARDYLKSKGLL